MFEKIDIGIKTFLRDEQLFRAISGIETNFSDARMIIADDGETTDEKERLYERLRQRGHIVDILLFDSGFGKKSNRIVELSYRHPIRPYILIGSDDFVFDDLAAHGLSDLQKVLDHCPDVDIASGRVNFRSYEFFLEISNYLFREGVYVKEHPVFDCESSSFTFSHARNSAGEILTPEFFPCDLTVNYSLIRREVFDKVKWDDDAKIGNGEHGAFFYDCKLAGFKTVCVPQSNISEQQVRNSQRYKFFRSRANGSDRLCLDKRNIVEYILGDGRLDYRREQ